MSAVVAKASFARRFAQSVQDRGLLMPINVPEEDHATVAAAERAGTLRRQKQEVGDETVTIGVCFAEQVVSAVPQESHDISVHRVISA